MTYAIVPSDEYLEHHGILGQKWGVRRYQNSDGTLTSAGKKRYTEVATSESEDGKTKYHLVVKSKDMNKIKNMSEDEMIRAERKEASKNRRSLSDADLKKRIERLQMEHKLKELTAQDLNPGRTKAKQILASIGTKTIATVASGAILYAGKAMLTKEFNPKEAAGYLFPKPKMK